MGPAFCPCPRGHLQDLAPGLLQAGVSRAPDRPSAPPLRGPSGTDPACLGGQASERHRASSESHSELGQSQGPRLIAQRLHLGISGLHHCASQALIPLCFYLLPFCFWQGHKGIMGPLGPPGPKGEKVGDPSRPGWQESVGRTVAGVVRKFMVGSPLLTQRLARSH